MADSPEKVVKFQVELRNTNLTQEQAEELIEKLRCAVVLALPTQVRSQQIVCYPITN
jgi:hypothetical protein